MHLYKHLLSLLLATGLLFTNLAFAQEPLPPEGNLIALNSHKGTLLLNRSANLATSELLANFTTQQTLMNCGVATAVIVLNSLIIEEAPTDPAYEDAAYNAGYFTQNTFFTEAVLEIITPGEVENNGMTLAQLGATIETYGLRAHPSHADQLTLIEFRAKVRRALDNGHYVTANFLRTALGQNGGGHHSPIAAYDEKTDQFLILDTARYRYPSFWVTADDLWDAINTVDDDAQAYRGFLVISNPA